MVYLKALRQPQRFSRFERLIQGRDVMGVQIVADQDDRLGFRVPIVEQPPDALGPVRPRPLPLGLGMAPTCKGLGEQEDAARAVADVLVVLVSYAGALGCEAVGYCKNPKR